MEEIREQLKKIAEELFDVEVEPEVTVAPESAGADFASNIAMKLAGQIGQPPREIAVQIAEQVSGVKTEVAGPGFLNFISPDEYYLNKIASFGDFSTKFGVNISRNEYNGKTVICEFSDPNPFKVLHVGHLYTSIVGDSISRLFELAGAKVVRANFGGDVGLHVAKNMWALMQHVDEIEKAQSLDEKAELMACCYVEGTRAYEDNETAKAEIVALNKELYRIAQEQTREGDVAELYWWGRETSYEYFRAFYAKIGLAFDIYYPESETAGRGLTAVQEHPEVYEESDGAIVFKGEPYGLHTRVFINKEGLPTYEAKDVGLLLTKWDDYHFDKSVVITGNDIIEYMKVVLKSVSLYAPELVERTAHLTHGNVKLPGNEKMSSRKGNFLRAVDILTEVATMLKGEYNSDDEKVVLGAVKYAFLKYKMGGDIEFNIKESVSMTGNSGPYLQYAAVRAKKILGSLMQEGVTAKDDWQMNEHERKLMRKMAGYGDTLAVAMREMAPHKVCAYLYELAQEFSRFYEKVKVVGSEYEAQRGELVLNYLKIMTHGLGLLGIEVPERM